MAIEQGGITVGEAEYLLYSPYAMKMFENLGVDSQVVELIWKGTSIEDIEEFLPEKFEKKLSSMTKDAIDLLKSLPAFDSSQSKSRWIRRCFSDE